MTTTIKKKLKVIQLSTKLKFPKVREVFIPVLEKPYNSTTYSVCIRSPKFLNNFFS